MFDKTIPLYSNAVSGFMEPLSAKAILTNTERALYTIPIVGTVGVNETTVPISLAQLSVNAAQFGINAIGMNYAMDGTDGAWYSLGVAKDNSDGQAAIADNTLRTVSRPQAWNSAQALYNRVESIVPSADTVATSHNSVVVANTNFIFDGTNYNRERGNDNIILLPSAVRSATTVSPDFTNYNGRAVIGILNISAVPGGGIGLKLALDAKDPISGNYIQIGSAALNASTISIVQGFAGLVGNATAWDGANPGTAFAVETILPITMRMRVIHSGAGSFTYSLAAQVIV
jgi:hypothetical protein